MNCIIPFEGKVEFDYPVKEICSISLEHEITKNDDKLLGNFLISGTCKEHTLSINTTDFNFVVPFELDFEREIDNDTLEFSIDNFTYDLHNQELLVNIDYLVNADDADTREVVNFEEVDSSIEEMIEQSIEPTLERPTNSVEEVIEQSIEPTLERSTNSVEEVNTLTEENTYKESNKFIFDDDYLTYEVHIMCEGETIENIAVRYNISKEELVKINGSSVEVGQKIIIPIDNE